MTTNRPSSPLKPGHPVEFLEIDRRQFLRLAGGTIVSLSAMSLIGCAGSGGGGGAAELIPASGTVVLPAGSALSLGQLTAGNLASTQAVLPNGQFTVLVQGTGPSLATVEYSAGDAILLGFVDSASPSNVIDAQSTAVALLYFAFGAYSLTDSAKPLVIAYLNGSAVTATLAHVLSTRVAKSTTAILNSDAAVGTALATAFVALGGSVAPANATAKRTQDSVHPMGQTLDLIVQPSNIQSGFEVLQASQPTSLAGTNHYRRRTQMWIYHVADMDVNGKRTDLPLAKLIMPAISVPPTTALAVGSTITNLFSRKTAFTPVVSAPISLALGANQLETFYEVVVLGGTTLPGQPAFFDFARYANEAPMWIDAVSLLNLETFLIDLVFTAIMELMGVRDLLGTEAQIEAVAVLLAGVQAVAWQQIIQDARHGYYGLVYKNALNLALGNQTASRQLQQIMAPLLPVSAQRSQWLAKKIKVSPWVLIKGVYAAAGILLGAGDLAAVTLDNTVGLGDLWTATVVKPTIHLNPTSVDLHVGAVQTFTVTAPTGLTGTVVWEWTLTGGVSAELDDLVSGRKGTILETSSGAVSLITTPSDINEMKLAVEGILVEGTTRTSVGSATAVITMSDQVQTEAGSLSVVVTPTNDNGRIAISALVVFGEIAGTTKYGIQGSGGSDPYI